MPTYIMLSTLTPEGVQTVKNNPQRIREVNKEVEQLGATVTAQWATLGHVDFISVVEAPDEATMARDSPPSPSTTSSPHFEPLLSVCCGRYEGRTFQRGAPQRAVKSGEPARPRPLVDLARA